MLKREFPNTTIMTPNPEENSLIFDDTRKGYFAVENFIEVNVRINSGAVLDPVNSA